MRLDQLVYEKGLAPSREKARALIMAGQILLNGEKVTKAGHPAQEGAEVQLCGEQPRYVSRGGLKLERALAVFPASPAGKVCMDVGASTGGFTDCMLQNDAAKVYSVDVGYGQLDWKLRSDARVVVMERTNIRLLQPADMPEKMDFFTVDASFISLKLVLPALSELATEVAEGICLVKPQFEAGKGKVGKNGVVRDAAIHLEVLLNCAEYAVDSGFSVEGINHSPVKGPKGNIEYLMYLRKSDTPQTLSQPAAQAACQQAHQTLNTD